MLAKACEEKQSAGEAFLGGVEQLVDQVFFDADVSREHVGDEAVGKFVLAVQDANHFVFFNDKSTGGNHGSGGGHAIWLARKASFAQKIPGSENGDDRFFAGFIDDSQFHAAFLNVENVFCRIALREDDFFCEELGYFSFQTGRVEKQFHIERRAS